MIDSAAYLERIGYSGPTAPTWRTLRGLHLAHLRAAPFENLDIHLGRPIVLDEDALFAKIVSHRRGGFCYELNGLFAALLRDLGFGVTLLAAQYPRDDGVAPPETDHLVLRVTAADSDEPRLVDVGAGGDSFALPLRTATASKQPRAASGANFRLVPEEGRQRLLRQEPGGPWEVRYAFTGQPRALADFVAGCAFHQTSPDSPFPRRRVCTRLTPQGRISLIEHRLITVDAGTRTERELADDAAYRDALRTHFGIALDGEWRLRSGMTS